MQDLNVMEGT